MDCCRCWTGQKAATEAAERERMAAESFMIICFCAVATDKMEDVVVNDGCELCVRGEIVFFLQRTTQREIDSFGYYNMLLIVVGFLFYHNILKCGSTSLSSTHSTCVTSNLVIEIRKLFQDPRSLGSQGKTVTQPRPRRLHRARPRLQHQHPYTHFSQGSDC
jgi:hypothetical protein